MKLEGELLYVWLAALIDGEGSIMLNKRAYSKRQSPTKKRDHYRAVISIANTNYKLFDALTGNTGISRIYQHRVNGPKDRPRARAQWTWRLVTTEIREWLPLILPYLVLKEEQANLLLEAVAIKAELEPKVGIASFRDDRCVRLDEIYLRIRQLNTRGRTLEV